MAVGGPTKTDSELVEAIGRLHNDVPEAMVLPIIAIVDERARQEAIWPGQTAAHPDSMSDEVRLAILIEEVGEAAQVVNDRRLGEALVEEDPHAELVQVAAVAVAWLEAIAARAVA